MSPVFVGMSMLNGRVVFDSGDVIAMLLTRAKESNSMEAEQVLWAIAQWFQGLVFGIVTSTGPGEIVETKPPSQQPEIEPPAPAEG